MEIHDACQYRSIERAFDSVAAVDGAAEAACAADVAAAVALLEVGAVAAAAAAAVDDCSPTQPDCCHCSGSG